MISRLYELLLETKTPTPPMMVASKRTFYIRATEGELQTVFDYCRERGWTATAIPRYVREWDDIERAFERTIELDKKG